MPRQILFQLHWMLGITAGVILAIVGLTGATLSFQDGLLRWMNPELARAGSKDEAPLAPAELLARIQAAHPTKAVVALTLFADGRHAPRVVLAPRETRYADPYTGRLSEALRGAEFFRTVMQLHRWLAAGDVGKQLVGASTLALVVLCISGLYLRWPRKPLDWRAWLTFDGSRKGRVFLSRLHATAGTWVLLPYLLMGSTGLYWSYDWYRGALFALSGTPRPAAQSAARDAPQGRRDPVDIGAAWAVFTREAPAYSSATLRFPQGRAQSIQVNYLDAASPHERAFNRMVLHRASGALLQHERYASKPAGARFMSSIFALHSGSFFGLPGVIALAIASALMPLFAITGWMLYLRRRSPAPILPARPARTPQRVGALAALAVHALAGVALLSHEPARSALIAAAPIMVDLIAPPKAEPKPAPPVEIVPPKPSRKPPAQPKAPAPLVTAAAEAPSPSIAPSPAPQQPPPEPQPAPIVAAPPAAAPVPVTPPVFSAQYLANPSPAYPALSRRRGEHGRVILRVLVSIEGKAEEVQVRTSSGHPRLDEVARNTVQSWRFVPARRGDQPIAAWALVPISFRLEG